MRRRTLLLVTAALLVSAALCGVLVQRAAASRGAFQPGALAPRFHTTTGPKPPPSVVKGYARTPARAAGEDHVIAGVPAYTWRHGCGPTATGMVAGYYDAHGFDDLIPGDAGAQTTAVLQAIASDQRDGGGIGHYQDYSMPRDDSGPVQGDRSAAPAGDEHASDSVADFMHTSWSVEGLTYGGSWTDMVGPAFTEFVGNRQPAYTASYHDYYVGDPISTTTWSVYKREVDAGRPMVLIVDCNGDGGIDHAITGVGYRETGDLREYAYYNTWDTSVHWAQYRPPSSAYAWGIWGVTTLSLGTGTTPDPPPDPPAPPDPPVPPDPEPPAPDPTPTPVITSISPASVWAGYAKNDLTLIVNGSDFLGGAHVVLGATEKTTTTYVGAMQLTVPLLAEDIASPGIVDVGVQNPASSGGASAATWPLAVLAETTDPVVTVVGADSAWHNTPVALTFAASDGQSGVQAIRYLCPPAVPAWTDGSNYVVPVATQGAIVVSAQATDWCGRVGSASVTVNIDTTKPTTDALRAVKVKRNKTAKLKFVIGEPTGLSPSAQVVLEVKAAKSGKVVKTETLTGIPMNVAQSYGFKATFRKGSYRWYVYATDLAGNTQVNVDSAAFTVK